MKPRQSIKHIALDHLVGHADNPSERLDFQSISELADSIREHGILQPLIVTEHLTDPDRWTILAGHRRAAAARLAGLHQVPCVARHGLDEDVDEQVVVMLVENCQRKDLAPMERAEMLGVLRDKQKLTLVEIARRTGLSESRVSDSLALLELDADSRAGVRSGEVGVGRATEAVRQVRAAARTNSVILGQPVRRRTLVRVEPQHFTRRHPLASKVKAFCSHETRPLVGGVGCGQCWEDIIRNDAIQEITSGRAS